MHPRVKRNQSAWEVASTKYLEETDDLLRRARTEAALLESEEAVLAPILQETEIVVHLHLVGRVLQRNAGQPEQVVVTVPLLVGTDGVEKMGKSAGNWIGIREPAQEQFGKLMSIPDSAVRTYAELCADFSPAQVDELEQRMSGEPAIAKRDLAEVVVALYHGEVAAKEARDTFDRVFKRRESPSDLPLVRVNPGPVDLAAVLVGAGMAKSKNEVRRLAAQGGLRLNGVALSESELASDGALLDGSVLQRGKRHAVRVALSDETESPVGGSDLNQ